MSYTYAANIELQELVFTVGAIDLFYESLPKLKNVYGSDLQIFDPCGRRIYTSLTCRMQAFRSTQPQTLHSRGICLSAVL